MLPLTILLLLTGLTFASHVAANPVAGMKPTYAKVTVESPQEILYNGSSIELGFTVLTNYFVKSGNNYSDTHCFISLDSKRYEFYGLIETARNTISNDGSYNPYTELTLTGNTSISNLGTGSHIIEIEYGFYYAFPDRNYQTEYIVLGSANVGFSADSNVSSDFQPTILLPTPYPTSYASISTEPVFEPTPSQTNISTTITPYTTQRNAPHVDPWYYLAPATAVLAVIVVLSVLLFGRRRKNR